MKIGHLALSGQAWLYFQSGSSNHDIWLGPKHAQRLHKAFTAIAKNPCLSLVIAYSGKVIGDNPEKKVDYSVVGIYLENH